MKKSKVFASLLFLAGFACLNAVYAAPLEGRLTLGYTDTTGNTEEEKVNFNFNLSEKRSERLILGYRGLANYGKSAGLINSDKKQLGVTAEFVQDENNSFYLNAGGLKDRFAGYDKRLNLGAGFFKHLTRSADKNLKAAAGIDITREDFTDSTSRDQRWLKLGLKGDKQLGKNITGISSIDFGAPQKKYKQRLEVDYMLGALFSVNNKIDLETKYSASYRRSALVAGKQKTDAIYYTSLVYKM